MGKPVRSYKEAGMSMYYDEHAITRDEYYRRMEKRTRPFDDTMVRRRFES